MAKLREVKGELRRLGNHTLTGAFTVYSVIDVGGQLITDVGIPSGLDSFVAEGLGGEVTLWWTKPWGDKKQIIAAKLPNGNLYYSVPGWGSVFFFLALSLIGCLFFFLGLLLLPLVLDLIRMNLEAGDFDRRGGIRIDR